MNDEQVTILREKS